MAENIMEMIFAEVEARAKLEDFISIQQVPAEKRVLRPVVERMILRELNSNPSFRARMRREIDKSLRSQHLVKVDPGAPVIVVPPFRRPPHPDGDTLRVRSSIGLGTASVLEAEPEEWDHYVVSQLANAHTGLGDLEDVDLDLERPVLQLYVVGAGAGGVARVVTAMKSAVKFDVQEYDTTLTDTTNLPCVVGTRGGGLVPCKFDAVVAVIPAPAVGGAAHQRSIYTGGLLPFDPGSMGPERWSGFVGGALRAASDLVDDEGIIYMLVPTGVREGTGYTSRPELLHVVLELARKVGLKVLEKLRIVEVEPVKQPFVGCNRPERWSIRFARSVAAGGVGP